MLYFSSKNYIRLFILDAFTELFLTICIVLNTLFLALDHHDMNPILERVLAIGNYVSFEFFTTFFYKIVDLKKSQNFLY